MRVRRGSGSGRRGFRRHLRRRCGGRDSWRGGLLRRTVHVVTVVRVLNVGRRGLTGRGLTGRGLSVRRARGSCGSGATRRGLACGLFGRGFLRRVAGVAAVLIVLRLCRARRDEQGEDGGQGAQPYASLAARTFQNVHL